MKPSQKSELRIAVLARRDAIPEAQRAARSRELSQRVQALPEFASARTILAYMPMGSEFDTRPLLQAILAHGRRLVLPRVDRATKNLALHAVGDLEDSLRDGVWGIREPDPGLCPIATLGGVDFVLMPGAAFDRQRRRMGYGGGFYDKLLSRPERRAVTVAVAFLEQLVPDVPVEPHDVPVDILVSDDGLYR